MKKLLALTLTAAMTSSLAVFPVSAADNTSKKTETVSYTYSYGDATTYTREMEKLDRGLVAVKTDSGVFLSWRLFDSEDAVFGSSENNVKFNIYRDGTLIKENLNNTNFTDTSGKASNTYSVAPVIGDVEGDKCAAASVNANNYFDVNVNKPEATTLPKTATFRNANGNSYIDFLDSDGNEVTDWNSSDAVWETAEYTLGDASCGDLDGDGEYEIVVKWDCGSKDNSQTGLTGTVYLDAYKMDGTPLWRIDLGRNIRSGAHYTQFLVYDFDGDGKAEVMCQTAPGSKDGTGGYVSRVSSDSTINSTDNTASYINSKGYILSGQEFLTVFNGEDGVAEDTIYYPNQRVDASVWGDTYGNRVDRFTASVAYIDGEKPYAFYMRGYYFGSNKNQRQTACAVSFDGSKLDCQYSFDTYDVTSYGSKSSSASYNSDGSYRGVNGYRSGNEIYVGQGNHNCTVADVDNDGKDEVLTGALCYELADGVLKPKWCTFRQHGDALHIGDYDPTHKGFEFFTVHEDGGTNSLSGTDVTMDYGMSVIDAESGEIMFHQSASGDTGRGIMANVGSGGYYQINSSAGHYQADGNTSFTSLNYTTSMNFRIFWDGDLYDELLDGTTITNWNGSTMTSAFDASSYDCISVNGTKANPSLQADLFGDWREEVVYPTSDNTALRVFTTTTATDYKIKTLMQDPVYRSGVAAEQTAYNQPPHVGMYLSADTIRGNAVNLAINTTPTKLAYDIGDNIDLTGCTLTVTYQDGTEEALSTDKCTVTGYDAYTSGTQTVSLAYDDLSVTFDVTVESGFEIDSATGLITGFNGGTSVESNVVIPEYIDGVRVTGIKDGALKDARISSLYIYNDITIGTNAFPSGITIYCYEDSTAYDYAQTNNISFVLIQPKKVYANVTFEEDEYSGYSGTTTPIAKLTATTISPLTFTPGLRKASEESQPFYKLTDSNGNSYLAVAAQRFSYSNRHGTVTFESIPNLLTTSEYEFSMDFYIQTNTKGLTISINDEDSKAISTLTTSTSGLIADTWYHYLLKYEDGTYTQTITDASDVVVNTDTITYTGGKAVKSLTFPVEKEAAATNYVYLDNISLTSPITTAFTVNVKDSSGAPIKNATVSLGDDLSAVTDANGNAVISALADTYTMTVSASGYLKSTSSVKLRRETQSESVTLESVPTYDLSVSSLIINEGSSSGTVSCTYNGSAKEYPSDTAFIVLADASGDNNYLTVNTSVTLTEKIVKTDDDVLAGWYNSDNAPISFPSQTSDSVSVRPVFTKTGVPIIVGKSHNSQEKETVRIFVPANTKCSVLTAAYNGDVLSKLSVKDINQTTDYSGTVGIISSDSTLKVMIWDSLENMKPISPAIFDSSADTE